MMTLTPERLKKDIENNTENQTNAEKWTNKGCG